MRELQGGGTCACLRWSCLLQLPLLSVLACHGEVAEPATAGRSFMAVLEKCKRLQIDHTLPNHTLCLPAT